MTREELKERINAQDIEAEAERWDLERDRSGRGWMCPEPGCKSGHGQHGTGMRVDRAHNRLHCFACGTNIDVLDIIQAGAHTDYNGALSIGASELGITPDQVTSAPNTTPRAERKPQRTPDGSAFEPVSGFPATLGPDTLNHRTAAAYLTNQRQLSQDDAACMGIRYDERHNSIIIPTGDDSYAYRPMYEKTPGESVKTLFVSKEKGGRTLPFNVRALRGSEPVAIVEGWENAVSLAAVGCPAVAIHGATLTGKLLNALDYMRDNGETIPTLMLALDADNAGRNATAKLAAALDDRGVRYIDAGPILYGEPLPHEHGDDPNDALRADRDAFAGSVQAAIRQAKDARELFDRAELPTLPEEIRDAPATENAAREARINAANAICNGSGYMGQFLNRLNARRGNYIPTGLSNLDAILHGGLRPGLTIIGGATGTGKTMLALQIGDYIAQHGRPVLYAALEMGRDELIARSVSRLSADMEAERRIGSAIDHLSLLDGKINGSGDVINAAIEYFTKELGPNMYHYTLDDSETMTARDIRTMAETIAEIRGTAPLVVVDYLQLLASENDRLTDKQAADRNVWALKKIARALDTPVLAIASFNRHAYKAGDDVSEVDGQAAYKESGGIEYTAEVLLNLYRGAQIGDARKMTLKMVKARALPVPSQPIAFWYRGQVSMFTPDMAGQH